MKTIDEIVESSKDKLKSQALSRDDLIQHIENETLGSHPGYRTYSNYMQDLEHAVILSVEPQITFGFGEVYYSVNGSEFAPEQQEDISKLQKFDIHVYTFLDQEISGLKLGEQEFRDVVFEFVNGEYSSEPAPVRMHHAEKAYEKYFDKYVNLN